jgi:hypothetical protein
VTRTILIAVVLPVFALAGLMAQTPAQSSGKPLRHLRYTFSSSYSGVSEYHYNGISDSSSGVGGAAQSEGGNGTMDVEVLSIAEDGALVIRISEWIQNEPRARQAFTCTVYGNTMVVCPSADPSPSDAEFMLLSYLGRQFVDAAPWDAQHHWQRTRDTSLYKLVEDFTMAGASDDKHAIILEKKKTSLDAVGFGSQTEDIRISYDRTMEVPNAIHNDLQVTGDDGSGHGTYDFKLASDSFAKAPANSQP